MEEILKCEHLSESLCAVHCVILLNKVILTITSMDRTLKYELSSVKLLDEHFVKPIAIHKTKKRMFRKLGGGGGGI